MSESLRIIQSIQAEEFWPNDPIAQEDYMFDRLAELTEVDAISAEEAQTCFNGFIMAQRPDVVIMNVPTRIARPFYE